MVWELQVDMEGEILYTVYRNRMIKLKRNRCDFMQSNAVLRKRAFRLYWQHRGMMWAIFLLFALVNLLWSAVQTYLLNNSLLESLLGIVYQLVTVPIMLLGLYHLLLRLTRGGQAQWPMLFDFVKSPEVLPKVLTVGLIRQFPIFIVNFSSLFGIPTIYQQELAIFVFVVALVAGLLILWIMLRLFLLPYLFVTNPKESVLGMVKSSFRMMKGQVRHLLWYGITVYWWAFALLIGAMLLFPSLVLANTSVSGQLMRQVVLWLIMAFLDPYFSLALTGYANELLSSEKDAKKAKRKR